MSTQVALNKKLQKDTDVRYLPTQLHALPAISAPFPTLPPTVHQAWREALIYFPTATSNWRTAYGSETTVATNACFRSHTN